MKKTVIYCIILLVASILYAFTTSNSIKQNEDKELLKFANTLIGTYSSKKQAIKDTNYFNISLVMYRVWPERTDGIWLYVEQAVASKLDKPYRQRVYRLQHPSTFVFTSDIYMIQNAKDIIGLQNDKQKESLLHPDSISIKEGCTVVLQYDGKTYTGGTQENKCPSDLRGASYASTKISLQKGKLISWDQGFDANGKQMWGATEGGYIFLKNR